MYSQKEVSEATIYNFASSFIKSKSLKLNTENIEGFLNNNIFNKVILFTERSETSILYKGISSFFYDKLIFGEIHKDNKALIKKFGVKTFPTIILYVTQQDNMYLDEPRIEYFNLPITARNIVYFIGGYALPEKMYLKLEKKENLEELKELKYKVSLKDLGENDYKKYLTTFISKRFIIYLSQEKEKEIPEDLKKISKNTNGFFLFVRFNCEENKEFCVKTFNVDTYPALLLTHKTVSLEDGTQSTDIDQRLKRSIKLSLDYESIEREILNEFPKNMQMMNGNNAGPLLGVAHSQNITPMIYFYENEIPIGLQLLSQEENFRKFVQFSEFKNPNNDILKNFQIKKIPSAIFLIKDQNDPKSQK
mgnify:CR=1 FL=1